VSDDALDCRIDVWLWRARFFKTRSLAARFVTDGGVRLTSGAGETRLDKPARKLRPGDRLTLAMERREIRLCVEALGERRGPAPEARMLYRLLDGAAQQPAIGETRGDRR
jgi:ribosomal 50S subunit-recycling heat shock protein